MKLVDSQGNELVAGALYCMFDNGVDGALVWFGSDGRLYDRDNDEERHDDFDALVRQPGWFHVEYAVMVAA